MASIIIIFAQVLNDPTAANKYLQKLNIKQNLAPNEIIFINYCGICIFHKKYNCSFRSFFQNFSIQKMCYKFKKKLLFQYAKQIMDYI